MFPFFFAQRLDSKRIEQAIAAAELRTSGELRVVIHRTKTHDPLALATKEFERLGMTKTRERNAILLLVAPRSRTFAFYGDVGIHAKCGPDFWAALAAELETDFKKGAFTNGIVAALEKGGELLAEHFPRQPNDRNELPDTVV